MKTVYMHVISRKLIYNTQMWFFRSDQYTEFTKSVKRVTVPILFFGGNRTIVNDLQNLK